VKVFVCGNINSGKSCCIGLLTKFYPDFSVIQIDEWRKKYGDGTLEGEQRARREFISAVTNTENAFVELSGMGPLGKDLSEKIESKYFIVLYIKENVELCLDRLSSKQLSNTPYPKFNEAIEDTIKRIDKELLCGELQMLWKDKALSILEITKDCQIADIPLMHYKYLIDSINRIKNNNRIREIIIYGSFARNNITVLSDIDMFVTTDYSVCEIEKIFCGMSDCTFIDTTENKVTLMFADILIEIVVVKKIQDNIKYYVYSNIKDVSIQYNNT
jgi:predicted nucleotidyltransferase